MTSHLFLIKCLLTLLFFSVHVSKSFSEDISDLSKRAEDVKRCWHKCPNLAQDAGEQAIKRLNDRALSQNDINAYAIIAGYLPRVYIDRGEFHKAEAITQRFLSENAQPSDLNDYARVLVNQGIIYKTTGRYILAKQTYHEALSVYESLEKPGAIGNVLNNLALISMSEDNLGEAVEYLSRALPLIQSGSVPAAYATALANVGVAYIEMAEYDLAQSYLDRALALIENTDHIRKKAEIFVYQSSLFIATEQFNTARIFANRALDLANSIEAKDTAAQIYHKLGNIELGVADHIQANSYLEQALRIAKEIDSSSIYNRVLISMINLKLLQNETDEAKTLIAPALESAIVNGQTDVVLSLQKQLLSIALTEDDFQIAYGLQAAIYDQYKTSSQAEKTDKIAQYAVLLDQQEKLKQIAELNQRDSENQIALLQANQSKRNLVFVVVLVAVVMLFAVFILIHRRRIAVMQAKAAANLVAQKDQMLSDVSHELKTPLAAIKLQVELIEHDLSDDPKQAFATVHNKIANLNRLINDVFQLALADTGDLDINLQKVKAKSLADDYFSNLSASIKTAGHSYTYESNITQSEIVYCDRVRIEQVFSNLITNSCRYTECPGQIKVESYLQEKQLVIVIEDSSPSIPEAYWRKVFERLYRIDKSRSREQGGSGLGLSLCKALIKAHSGTIRLGNSALGGLSVTLRLPLHFEPSEN